MERESGMKDYLKSLDNLISASVFKKNSKERRKIYLDKLREEEEERQRLEELNEKK